MHATKHGSHLANLIGLPDCRRYLDSLFKLILYSYTILRCYSRDQTRFLFINLIGLPNCRKLLCIDWSTHYFTKRDSRLRFHTSSVFLCFDEIVSPVKCAHRSTLQREVSTNSTPSRIDRECVTYAYIIIIQQHGVQEARDVSGDVFQMLDNNSVD